MVYKKVFFLPLIFLVLIGCSIFDDTNKEENLDCEESVPMPTPIITSEKRYYIILVEGSEEYRSYREEGISILTTVFGSVLESGDHLVAIWMEVTNLGSDNAVFFTTDFVDNPQPENSPEPEPRLIPTPTPLSEGVTPSSRIQHDNETNRINAINEDLLKEHLCENVNPVRENNNQNIESWELVNENELERINNEFTQSTNTSNLDYMSVYEALKLASDIFIDNCSEGEYDDCQLIIVSNLVDWRSNLESPEILASIQQMNIDLSYVSVAVIWPDCQFFSDQFKTQCESRKETWTRNFSMFRASEDQGNLIFINIDNAVDKLIKFIGD